MNKSVFSLWRKSVAVALVIALAACGGGGGNSSAPTTSSDTTGTTTGTTTTTPTSSPTLTLAVFDATPVQVYDVTTTGTFKARATLRDAAGNALDSVRVNFSTGDANLTIGTASKTTSSGIAETVVSPSASSSGGAVTLTATAVSGSTTLATQTINFNVAAGAQPAGVPTLSVSVNRVSTGAAVNAIDLANNFEIRGTLLDANRNAMPGVLLSFSLGAFTNATLGAPTAVTDSNGLAKVTVTPAGISSVGGALVTVQTASGSSSASAQGVFSVTPTTLTLQPLQITPGPLASAASTPISVQTSASGFSVNVTFTASCGRINGSALTASVTTNGSGLASATYQAVNADGTLCSGTVSFSASAPGATSVADTVNVNTPIANAITFETTQNVRLFVKGSGGLEQGTLKFKVLDTNGNIIASEKVIFSIVINPGGLSINAPGNTAPVELQSGADGVAQVSVFSGTIPGPVKIRATLLTNSSVFAESQNVTVASGPPSQRFISVSVGNFNIEGADIDGTSTTITARVADRQGNAVEDGTVVNFTAEGGQVGYSCSTTTVNRISSCSVDFQSQNPRPAGGRVSLLAYVEGSKDYIDIDGNNVFSGAGTDTLLNIGDAYRDDDEDRVFDPGEFRIPRGVSGATLATCATDVGGSFPSVRNSCNDNLATTVRQQAVILFSSSTPSTISLSTNTRAFIAFSLASAGNVLLPMPAGTVVSAQASGTACAVDKVYGAIVPNISPTIGTPGENLTTGHSVALKGCVAGDTVAITITAPSGLATTQVFTLP